MTTRPTLRHKNQWKHNQLVLIWKGLHVCKMPEFVLSNLSFVVLFGLRILLFVGLYLKRFACMHNDRICYFSFVICGFLWFEKFFLVWGFCHLWFCKDSFCPETQLKTKAKFMWLIWGGETKCVVCTNETYTYEWT